jgi:hypothetical protein
MFVESPATLTLFDVELDCPCTNITCRSVEFFYRPETKLTKLSQNALLRRAGMNGILLNSPPLMGGDKGEEIVLRLNERCYAAWRGELYSNQRV